MYQFLKKILFSFDPEKSHHLALRSLQLAYQIKLLPYFINAKIPPNPRPLMGLSFSHPVGLAAGLDKNADYVDALAALGFSFIEIGTVTPKPQEGNPQPRLFRLTKQEAIINRMGFNSKGMDYVSNRLAVKRYNGILGVNIGKNKETPIERATDDYITLFRKLWPYASYITINISSPNTAGLRDLQQENKLNDLLSAMKQEQRTLELSQKKYLPLVVKISPDLTEEELRHLANVISAQQIDGVIATNTTLSRQGVEDSPYAKEAGGLSGKPLTMLSTNIIQSLRSLLPASIPIIASGGVMDEISAKEKLNAGADLLQIYTGFIYSGSGLIKKLARLSVVK